MPTGKVQWSSESNEFELFRPYRPIKRIPVQVVHFVTIPDSSSDLPEKSLIPQPNTVNSSIRTQDEVLSADSQMGSNGSWMDEFHEHNSKFRQRFLSDVSLKSDDGSALNQFSDSNNVIKFDFYLMEEPSNEPRVDYSLLWEKHTAFETYTFFRYGSIKYHSFAWKNLLTILENNGNIPGKLVVYNFNLTFVNGEVKDGMILEPLQNGLENGPVVGSYILGERARVQISSKFDYVLVNDFSSPNNPLSNSDAALLIQHLLYIRTYMGIAESELSAKIRYKTINDLDKYDADIDRYIKTVEEIIDSKEVMRGKFSGTSELLRQIAGTWGDIEGEIGKINSKLLAAQTHHSIAIHYVDQLNEKSINGLSTIRQFLHRSIDPSIISNENILRRLSGLAAHANRLNELLRTRAEFNMLRQESWISLVLFFLTSIAALYYGSQILAHLIESLAHLIGFFIGQDFSQLFGQDFSQLLGIIIAGFFLFTFLFVRPVRRFWLERQLYIRKNIQEDFISFDNKEINKNR